MFLNIQGYEINTNTNLLIKKLYDGLYDRLFSLNQTEKRDLQLNPSHCQLTYKNYALWVYQEYYQYIRACQSHF